MSSFTSVGIVKLVGSRGVSRLIWSYSALKHSFLLPEKSSKLQSLNFCSRKCPLVLESGYTIYNAAALYRLIIHRSVVSACVPRSIPQRPYQTKSKDFSKEDDDNTELENKTKSVLDDLEFQSILKDFAQDFGVNDEGSKILEEIKQTHSSPLNEEIDKSLCKPICASHQLPLKDYAKSKTVNNLTSEDKYVGLTDHTSSMAPLSKEIQDDVTTDEFFHIDQELERSVEYDAKRGKTGVYDIDELVTILKEESLINISVIQVPEFFHYADYLVLATAKSPRHCNAVMEFIIKLYKKKKGKNDPFVKCEGEKVSSWKALDMGHIILHIFLEDTRNYYDIESLWLLDKKYDSIGSVKSDPEMDIMQHHLDFLNILSP